MASQKPRRAKQPGKPAPASKQPPMSSGSKTGWPAWALPNLTVFVSSLCIMVVELVAGRLIARYVGSSLYTWTSVIGIVLAGIAGGNYVGGRLADRYPPRRTLSLLFLLSASLCVLTPVLNDLAGGSSFLRGQEWSVRITTHVLCVFFLPSFMMGAISPVAAKMALDNGRETGRTVGSVYSWGAVGSIVGTFFTGYFLIAWMGTVATLLSVSAVLLAMALVFGVRGVLSFAATGVVLAAFVFALGTADWLRAAGETLGLREPAGDWVYFKESQYMGIRIQEGQQQRAGVRAMILDSMIHAFVSLNNPTELRYGYEQIYAEVTEAAVNQTPQPPRPRALFLGGGGFVFPRWVLERWPESYAEVSEIDPEVTEAAFEALLLPRDTQMKIFNLDARNHVDDLLRRLEQGEDVGRFDLVYGDAFNHYSPPFHLTTLEFVEKTRRLMSPQGVFLANVIENYQSGRFLGSMVNTLGEGFPHIYVFCACEYGPVDEPDLRNTFVVVGSMVPLPLESIDWTAIGASLMGPQHLKVLRERSQGLVLTDDYAPVHNMLAPVLKMKGF